MTIGSTSLVALALLLSSAATSAQESRPAGQRLEFRSGDRIVVAGNAFAERMQHWGFLEAALQTVHPEKRLAVRHLGWSADEVALRPRPLNFGTLHDHLRRQRATLVIFCFGLNEAYRGAAGLTEFEREYDDLVVRTTNQRYDGRSPPRVVLVSPIAHELHGGHLPGPEFVRRHNRSLARYTKAVLRVAARNGCPGVDLFTPTLRLHGSRKEKITVNGIHLSGEGYRTVCALLLRGLGVEPPPRDERFERVRSLVVQKNRLFFRRYRAVNGEYIYGRRKRPFGVKNFPREMARLDEMVADLDRRIWEAARP